MEFTQFNTVEETMLHPVANRRDAELFVLVEGLLSGRGSSLGSELQRGKKKPVLN